MSDELKKGACSKKGRRSRLAHHLSEEPRPYFLRPAEVLDRFSRVKMDASVMANWCVRVSGDRE